MTDSPPDDKPTDDAPEDAPERYLVSNVLVAGTWWGPDYGNAGDVPADVAELITNPGAWESDDEGGDARSDELVRDATPRKASAKKAGSRRR